MWQMGGVGPMFGQLGFFNKFAGKAYEDQRPRDRYAAESARLLGVLDDRLAGRDWVMDEGYSIADISLLGWRSGAHTSELQSLMRISYALLCAQNKKKSTS